jgi:hypothetical protein
VTDFLILVIPSLGIATISFSQLTALVSGDKGTCVWWESVREDGYAYLNLKKVKTKSDKRMCYLNTDLDQKMFSLIIPEDKENGLEPGAKYKFVVKSNSEEGGPIAESYVVVETKEDLYIDGGLEVQKKPRFECNKLHSQTFRFGRDTKCPITQGNWKKIRPYIRA